jgi:hypothetical protein
MCGTRSAYPRENKDLPSPEFGRGAGGEGDLVALFLIHDVE